MTTNPNEPTEAMIEAGLQAFREVHSWRDDGERHKVVEIWKAMQWEAERETDPAPQSASPASEDVVKHMTQRFLMWRLPEDFHPDAGISFMPEFSVEYMAAKGKPPMRHTPVGTNLFSATQAEAMVRFMLEGVASPTPRDTLVDFLVRLIALDGRDPQSGFIDWQRCLNRAQVEAHDILAALNTTQQAEDRPDSYFDDRVPVDLLPPVDRETDREASHD